MKKLGKKNIIFKRLVIFAIAAFMWTSTINMISVTPVISAPSGAPPPIVDGVINPGEYDDGMHIVLEGPWDSPSSPYDGPLDGYLYWDTQYLWIAVNEPVPEWVGGGSFIEFMWDAGIHGTMPYYHAWVLFSNGNWQYVRCGKPSGSWGWAADPFPGHSWWATNTATEFKFDYTDYGTQYGDTIKLIVDSADRSASSLTFGNCQIWPYVSPSNPDYYPSETPASVATWGDVTLGGAGPPIADAGGPYGGLVGASIPLDGTGSFDIGGTIVSYEWDLDYDGLYDDATGSTTTNSWSSDGTYTISLKVTDNDGLTDTDDATVNIGSHAVDGVISPGEYDGGMAVQLVGIPPESSWTVDAYIDWDSQYLYVGVDEPNPSYIEFAFDAGTHRSFYDVFTLFDTGSTSHQTSPKPPIQPWSKVPYSFTASNGPATELKVDYTDFGIALGDTIKMCIERGAGSPNAYWPEGGVIWDNGPRGPDPSTWGDVTLTGGGPPPPPDHIVDGVIVPDEYDGGATVQLVGKTDPGWTVDAYIDWDSEYLYLAVNEPVPHYPTGSGLDWIEFGIDPTPSSPDIHFFGFFGTGLQTYMGSLGSYTYLAASSTATEFRIKYTDFGITEGDTIKMEIDRNDNTAPTPPAHHTYGFAAFWPENAKVYSPDAADSTTWGDVTLSAAPPPPIPPVADANGPYEDTDCDTDYTINLDGSGSYDPDGTIVSYDWDFGDGTGWHSDIGATPSNAYPAFGEYTVTLRVTDGDALTDTDTTTVKIYGVIADAGGPYEDTDCDDDYTINFDGSGSTGYQTPLIYDWDFGDGTGWHNDIGATPSNTYPTFGEYTVTLRVTESGNGCYDINTTSAKIYKVTANANGPYSSVDGTPVQFDSSGSTSCCGDTLSYTWDFDDGVISPLENPTHTYTSVGIYTATLTVEGSISHCTDVDTATVTVTSTVVSDADGPYEGVVGIPIDFTGSASGGAPPYQYYWGFGDSTYSPVQNPSYTYDTPGTYPVSLKVTDDIKGTDTNKTYVLIHPAEELVADADGPYAGDVDEVIQFHGSAIGGTQPYSWYWEFGDGDTSTLQNPTHTYDTLGDYTATLTVTDTYGITDDDTAQVSIGGYPPNKPTITGSISGEPGTEYEYTFNAVDPDGDNVKYHINWGDTNSETTAFSSSGTDVKVKHNWSTAGNYTIKATAEDSNGLLGPEGTLSVSMPRNRATQRLFIRFLENLMHRFPLLAKLLQQYPILYQLLQRVLRL